MPFYYSEYSGKLVDGFRYLPKYLSGLLYDVSNEAKLPIYGTGAAETFPSPGWTSVQNASADDTFLQVNLPFTFYISDVGYTSVFVSSNTYITFGSGSGVYGGLSGSNPEVPKVMFGAADNSYQRVSTFSSNADYTSIRYEGTNSTSGILASPNIVLEITLFNREVARGNNIIELLVGTHARTSGVAFIASSTTIYQSYTLSQNQSYVFVGNSTGTSWQIYTGYSVLR